jgi:hypothetical protein
MIIGLYCLLGIYSLYTLVRAWSYFNDGIKMGLLGYGAEDIKLYHILWGIIDIPAMILGSLFPVLKFFFNIPVFPLKKRGK